MPLQVGIGSHVLPNNMILIQIIVEGGIQSYACPLSLDRVIQFHRELGEKIVELQQQDQIVRSIVNPFSRNEGMNGG